MSALDSARVAPHTCLNQSRILAAAVSFVGYSLGKLKALCNSLKPFLEQLLVKQQYPLAWNSRRKRSNNGVRSVGGEKSKLKKLGINRSDQNSRKVNMKNV